MRYRSPLSGGLQVFAVAGTSTVSFGFMRIRPYGLNKVLKVRADA